jgi:hypothetical protein
VCICVHRPSLLSDPCRAAAPHACTKGVIYSKERRETNCIPRCLAVCNDTNTCEFYGECVANVHTRSSLQRFEAQHQLPDGSGEGILSGNGCGRTHGSHNAVTVSSDCK